MFRSILSTLLSFIIYRHWDPAVSCTDPAMFLLFTTSLHSYLTPVSLLRPPPLLLSVSVYFRYCFMTSVPLARPSLLFRSVYTKPDKLVVVLQFVINQISLTLSYSKPRFLLKSHSSSSSLPSPSPLRLSGTYPVTP
jgi:hypothetical protein